MDDYETKPFVTPSAPPAADPDAMPFGRPATTAERKRRQRQREREQTQRLLYTVADWRQFVDCNTLPMQAGASWDDLPALVLKEIVDNACDESGDVKIELAAAGWRISDRGPGIDPGEVSRFFSVARPMLSSKRTRMPRRGMLGQGLRVVAGYIGILGGAITVASRGVTQTLRIDTISGETVVSERTACDSNGWTEVTLAWPGCDDDEAISDLARRTIAFAKRSVQSLGYEGPSSPWWYGAEDFRFLCVTAPADATVADVVRDLGLTVPRCIEGTKRASTISTDNTAAILAVLRERNREPPPQRLGHIGRDGFEDYDGYAIEHGIAALRSGARVPFIVEAYARCKREKRYTGMAGGGATFINRSPALDNFHLHSGYEKSAFLDGHGIGRIIEVKPGTYELALSVITPFVPLISTGKAPDLKHLSSAIVAAVEKAFKLAHREAPPPDEADGARREKHSAALRRAMEERARAQRAQAREAELEAWRSLPGPRPLLEAMEAASEESGHSQDELSVLTAKFDPFRQDTPQRHRLGQWLAERITELCRPGEAVHLRGLHYRLVAAGNVVWPGGNPYRNNEAHWGDLGDAARAARWLGYVPWNMIIDERNDPPVWQPASGSDAPVTECSIVGSELANVPGLEDLLPTIMASASYPVRQRHQLALFGEKTSLRPVLASPALEFGAHLVLPSGDPSLTILRDLAEVAVADGRELIVFCCCDFDPTGYGMPAAVARHLQAHQLLLGSDIRIRVIRTALNIEHVDTFGLPEAPLKVTEKRADKWGRQMGRGQVEIDALAALRPADLTTILRDAVEPFFDATLAARCSEAEAAWRRKAEPLIKAALTKQPERAEYIAWAAGLRQQMEKLSSELRVVLEEMTGSAQNAAGRITLPKLPPVQWRQPDAAPPEPLFDSNDGFVKNTLRLRAAKLKEEGG